MRKIEDEDSHIVYEHIDEIEPKGCITRSSIKEQQGSKQNHYGFNF